MDKTERIENLPDFLETQGLEVVRGEWLHGSPYPVLFVRPKSPPQKHCACGHDPIMHDLDGGACLAISCECPAYTEAA